MLAYAKSAASTSAQLVLFATLFFVFQKEAPDLRAAPLTNATQILSLSPEIAAQSLPVDFEGTLLLRVRDGALIIHDGSGSIYALSAAGETTTPRRGQRVRVQGVTDPGHFAPVIRKAHFTIEGESEIPPARPVTFAELVTGRFDGQWVELQGIVRSANTRPGWPSDSIVEIATGAGRIPLLLHGAVPAAAEKLVDCQVTARGVCLHFYNKKGQFYDSQIAVSESDFPQITHRPEVDPFQLPVRSPASLLRYAPDGAGEHRLHLRGSVTCIKPGYSFYLQDGSEGVLARTRQKESLQIGDCVDVVGFAGRGHYGPVLEDATFRKTGGKQVVAARRVAFEEALDAEGELVQLTGVVVDHFCNLSECVTVVRSGEKVFTAHLPHSPGGRESTPPLSGARVALTGICQPVMGSPEEAQWKWSVYSFRLLLRDASDLALLAPPVWWKSTQFLWAAISALGVALAALAALSIRARFKLREQQLRRAAAEAEFGAILKERNRVAREIHDTLAQAFTSVSVRLEIVRARLLEAPEEAAAHLDTAREQVRMGIAEARRSVWGLRPQILENRDLPSALEEIGRQLTQDSPIAFEVTVEGQARRLPPYLENDLVRIGQEAITNAVRHSQATRISVHLKFSDAQVELRVRDTGVGLAPQENSEDKAPAGFGLIGMNERARQLNADLRVRAEPGWGTELAVTVAIP
jgi:signal transduction histidine kinase